MRLTFCFLFLALAASAPASVNIRQNLHTCAVFLMEPDAQTGEDSSGDAIVTGLHPTEVRDALSAYVQAHGRQSLDGRELYVTGVEMGDEKVTAKGVEQILISLDLDPAKIHVHVLSVPRRWVKGTVRALLDRFFNWFPSFRLDYQKPLRDEIVTGAVATGAIEVPNAIYVLSTMPTPDAVATLTGHTLLLAAYTIWSRSIGNWVVRALPDEQAHRRWWTPRSLPQWADFITRQAALSLPFVVNYNVAGNFTALTAYFAEHGSNGLLAATGDAMAKFAATQSVTLALQTLFYSWVIARGIDAWSRADRSPELTVTARAAAPLLKFPWQAADAVILTMAAAGSAVIFEVGKATVNTGHLALAVITLAGSAIVFKPQILEATLPVFAKIFAWCGRMKRWLFGAQPAAPEDAGPTEPPALNSGG